MHSGSAFESQQQQQQHRRGLSFSSSVARDRDDDLTLFKDMQRREQERKAFIPEEPQMQTPRSHKSVDHSPHRLPAASASVNGCVPDDLFASDFGKTDYDWLMTPPGTPLLLPVDDDSINKGVLRAGAASVRSALKTSKLGNSNSEPLSRADHGSKNVRSNLGLQQPLKVNSICSSSSTFAKPVFSGVPRSSSQGINPAAQPSTPSPAHLLRHAHAGAIASTRPSLSLASVGTPQGTMHNGSVNAETSSARATVPSCRSACSLRSSTPVKRLPSPIHSSNPPTTLVRCSSANRATSLLSRGATLSRACSPTSKAWFPEAFHDFSQERPPNLRTSMLDRSLSNSRGSTSKTFQAELSDKGVRSRRRSSSSVMARGPSSTAMQNGSKFTYLNTELDGNAADSQAAKGSISKLRTKGCSQGGQSFALDCHVQKPARSTPLQDVKSMFSSIRESSALGQNLSKKSLDLTRRHMDICKSTPQKLCSFMSSMSKSKGPGRLGVKASGTNNAFHTTSSVLDSPMATSSSTSSEHNMSIVIDPEGSELGDETISEKGSRSSAASQHDLFILGKDKRITSWLQSPDYRDDDADIMQIFEQAGLESLSGPESPFISELDGTIECDDFSLDPI